MKRRRLQSIALIPKCGYVAICEEGRGWVFTFDDPKWRMLLELPPIDDADATIAEINRHLKTACFTCEEFVKEYGGRLIGYGEYAGSRGDGTGVFLDPSLGQPWPEDQASDQVRRGMP
jgi:hypothetical protein